MSERPHVSVLVVSYRQEAYIRDCLESVLSQDYLDFEVVLSDDASPDATVAIAQSLSSRFPHSLRILTSPMNTGITENVNRGLRACRGDYVALLGGDDLAFPGKIASMTAVLDAHPEVSLCYHDMEVFSDDGSVPRHLGSSERKPREGTARDLVRHGNFALGSSVMVRRWALPPDGLQTTAKWASDWLLNIEVARKGRITYLPQVFGGYRWHRQSVIRQGLTQKDPETILNEIETRWPEYRFDVRFRRTWLIYEDARSLAHEGRWAEAKKQSRTALVQRQRWPPKVLAWLLLAGLGFFPTIRGKRFR